MAYVPERGDVVWITFNPQAGHEQAGYRPAVVLSPKTYNGKVGLALLCPITSQIKGYPFEVEVPEGLSVNGVILSDQVKSLDWKARNAGTPQLDRHHHRDVHQHPSTRQNNTDKEGGRPVPGNLHSHPDHLFMPTGAHDRSQRTGIHCLLLLAHPRQLPAIVSDLEV
jgi:mRNA interferase MazF